MHGAAGGKRVVDVLVFEMIERANEVLHITDAVWLDMLRREVGEEAIAMHRAMLSGGLIVPESNEFGPCFRRTTKMIRRFDVGFDFSSLIGADKVVSDQIGRSSGSERVCQYV